MKRLRLRLGPSVLGMVGALLWRTDHDKGSSAPSMSHIPAKMAEGGNQLQIDVEAGHHV